MISVSYCCAKILSTCTILNIPKAGNSYGQHLTRSSISFMKLVKSLQKFHHRNLWYFPFHFAVSRVSSAVLKCRKFRQSATIAFLCTRNRLNRTRNGVRLTRSTSVGEGHGNIVTNAKLRCETRRSRIYTYGKSVPTSSNHTWSLSPASRTPTKMPILY